MFLFFALCLLYLKVYGDFGDLSVPICNDQVPLYILEGRIVQVNIQEYNSPPYTGIVIKVCKQSGTEIPEILNLNELLKHAARVELRGVAWPTLQETSQLERVDMLDVTLLGVWGDCSKLSVLFIRAYSKSFLTPHDWLDNCTQLHEIILAQVTVAEVRTIVDSAPNIESVQIFALKDEKVSHLVKYPLISTARGRHKSITKLLLFGIHRENGILKTDAQNNPLEAIGHSWAEVSVALVHQISLLPRLESWDINEKNFDFCPTGNHPSVILKSLQTLRLWTTGTSQLCFKKLRIMPQLKYLAVWYSDTINVQFSELYSEPTPELVINFDGIRTASLKFVRDDYMALSTFQTEGLKKGNVTLTGLVLRMECDCKKTLWFARALREGLVTAPGVSCNDGSSPKDLSCEEISCERVKCVDPCVCCARRDGVVADCRGAALRALPPALLRQATLTALLAPDNHLNTLPEYLPDGLQLLDLSGNNIWQDGAGAVSALFAQPARRVRLAGNNIFCSCDNKLLITTLQDHREQIEDFEKLACAITGQKLGEVNVTDLCKEQDRDAALRRQSELILKTVPIALILIVTSLILGIIMYYKRRELQIFLFSRGWCLCCVKEEELDSDRRYDVFLSFCHVDTELVLQNLLPTLDKEYSVCVHLRDWCPGDVIPSQINRSVEQSRRTIVVLSRDFVKSVWGRLEFETAHVSGLMEGRVRVVMIILDDVLEWEALPTDLRAYVRLNTYVRWGDPWFWEKLRFSLPHHRKSRVRHDVREEYIVETDEIRRPDLREVSQIDSTNNVLISMNSI